MVGGSEAGTECSRAHASGLLSLTMHMGEGAAENSSSTVPGDSGGAQAFCPGRFQIFPTDSCTGARPLYHARITRKTRTDRPTRRITLKGKGENDAEETQKTR